MTGPSDLITNEENGLLVELGNTMQLSEAIQRVIVDEQLRSRLANNAKRIRVSHSTKLINAKWQDLISSLVHDA